MVHCQPNAMTNLLVTGGHLIVNSVHVGWVGEQKLYLDPNFHSTNQQLTIAVCFFGWLVVWLVSQLVSRLID